LYGIDKVNANCSLPKTHLVGTGTAGIAALDTQHLRTAELAQTYCAIHRYRPLMTSPNGTQRSP